MSVRIISEIKCDVTNCSESIAFDGYEEEALQLAVAALWKRLWPFIICPKHDVKQYRSARDGGKYLLIRTRIVAETEIPNDAE